jgi:hypothetical protein
VLEDAAGRVFKSGQRKERTVDEKSIDNLSACSRMAAREFSDSGARECAEEGAKTASEQNQDLIRIGQP